MMRSVRASGDSQMSLIVSFRCNPSLRGGVPQGVGSACGWDHRDTERHDPDIGFPTNRSVGDADGHHAARSSRCALERHIGGLSVLVDGYSMGSASVNGIRWRSVSCPASIKETELSSLLAVTSVTPSGVIASWAGPAPTPTAPSRRPWRSKACTLAARLRVTNNVSPFGDHTTLSGAATDSFGGRVVSPTEKRTVSSPVFALRTLISSV